MCHQANHDIDWRMRYLRNREKGFPESKEIIVKQADLDIKTPS
jgi:hypothetical protein